MRLLLAVVSLWAVGYALPIDLWYRLVGQKPLGLTPPLFVIVEEPEKADTPAITVTYEQFERWANEQGTLAFDRISQNIGGYGLKDLPPGTIIASVSKSEPNYFYQWIRDSALTINSLITKYDDNCGRNETLKQIILDYIENSVRIQRVDNPSGDFETLEGLGEPKFHADGSSFDEIWGRPQRDGPALRSMAVMNYIESQVRHNSSTQYSSFASLYYSVVKPDLDYIKMKWRQRGFDIWEEQSDQHLFTHLVQLQSLLKGTKLSRILGLADKARGYYDEAVKLQQFIVQNYYDSQKGHLIESLHSPRSGLNAAIFIGMHVSNDTGFDPYGAETLSTLDKLINDMGERFPVNRQRISRLRRFHDERLIGVGIGRYPEDVYDGVRTSSGNPWFLTTAAVAQTLYRLADHLNTQVGHLEISDQLAPFYSRFTTHRTLARHEPEYNRVVRRIAGYADSFLDVIREHSARDGTMSEQFNRQTGFMQGASELTWSYSALWSALRQRNHTLANIDL